jgi:hypothetical protein
MKRLGLLSLVAVLLLASGLWAETQGTFRGEVVRPPHGERSAGLLYLMGRDGNVRRVVVARAAIVYDASVPSRERRKPAGRALTPGTEVIANHAGEFEDDYGDDSSGTPDQVTAPREITMATRTL